MSCIFRCSNCCNAIANFNRKGHYWEIVICSQLVKCTEPCFHCHLDCSVPPSSMPQLLIKSLISVQSSLFYFLCFLAHTWNNSICFRLFFCLLSAKSALDQFTLEIFFFLILTFLAAQITIILNDFPLNCRIGAWWTGTVLPYTNPSVQTCHRLGRRMSTRRRRNSVTMKTCRHSTDLSIGGKWDEASCQMKLPSAAEIVIAYKWKSQF